MKLNKIIIKNFRSYYGENVFEFSPGLTLVIGDNGDGKTTFFEALEWLFDTSVESKPEAHISAMRKAEMSIHETDEVSVSLLFEHNGEKEICKKFTFEKISDKSAPTRDFSFYGYTVNGTERSKMPGKNLLESCFDSVLRRYCLFKGESDLNVFDNSTALKTLVDTFSGIKQFDELVDVASHCEQESDKLVRQELKKDKKQGEKTSELDRRLNSVETKIRDTKDDIKRREQAVLDFESQLRILEDNQEACEQLNDIKQRINCKKNLINQKQVHVDVNYNALLLDDMWVLRCFPSILAEYQKKASAFSQEKRRLQKEEDQRRSKEQGKQEAYAELQNLANGVAPLPWNLPDKGTMEEMIKDEVCKVCGRPAQKGSEAYEYMVQRLQNYLDHISQEAKKRKQEEEYKPLFINEYINELHTKSVQVSGDVEEEISKLKDVIIDRLAFIRSRSEEVEQLKKDLQEAEDDKTHLLIQYSNLSEDMLEKGFKDYKGLSESSKRAEVELEKLKGELARHEEEKTEIKNEQAQIVPTNGIVKVYQRVHIVLDKILRAVEHAKENNVTEFLEMLQNEANKYLQLLNDGDFHGIVKIKRTSDGSARVSLYSSDDTLISNPGGAQRTTMYMSVLFAISNITTLKREEDYPLIFDAPTSSFGEFKEDVFYNIIDQIDKQCVIFTKDLLLYNRDTKERHLDEEKIEQLSCSVYRIQKAPGYDVNDLSTIKTVITKKK